MIAGIDADKGRSMVVVDLYIGKIGDAVFSFGKNSVTTRAMKAVKHFPFISPLDQGRTRLLPYVTGNIIFHLLLRFAVAEREDGE